MNTTLEKIDALAPEGRMDVFNRAADILRTGGLVAFPTETVYGLGANALDAAAVKKIYEAKGRPSDNPMIVHLADRGDITPYVRELPPSARSLMEAFWPGPLTLIFYKTALIPLETSGGLDTVAIRVPRHPAARLLIRTAGFPLAAPSANSSGKPSPTRASHVMYDLEGKIQMILDGGSADGGLESTIVDVTEEPCLLRPGAITREMLEAVAGEIRLDPSLNRFMADGSPKAPGMKYTHYAPKAKVTVVIGELPQVAAEIRRLAESPPGRIGILATEQSLSYYEGSRHLILSAGDRQNPATIAGNLFKVLRKFDYHGIEQVYAEGFEETELGMAIMNRLKKAAGYRIIRVE